MVFRRGVAEYLPQIILLAILILSATTTVYTWMVYKSMLERTSQLLEHIARIEAYTRVTYYLPYVVAWTDGTNTYVYNNLNETITVTYDSSTTTIPPLGNATLSGSYSTLLVSYSNGTLLVAVSTTPLPRSKLEICSSVYTPIAAVLDPATNFVLVLNKVVPPRGCIDVDINEVLVHPCAVSTLGNVLWSEIQR